ncbi:hypothetical protein [Pseudomonas aeruginosa]|uniref:hypothetical protein n=1 Tax=Pseudomonas aeruginosa TaxID=287 RepID=UPI001AAEBFEB|nr:hypothetical protein [Pseudomonas aeruginosa]MBO2834807.1 hypothetical protein [Pseudomonas aeruginosa]
MKLFQQIPAHVASGMILSANTRFLSYIPEQLRRESPTGEQLLRGLRLHCTFKDVTLEMLKRYGIPEQSS